jgi:hypothetical protein
VTPLGIGAVAAVAGVAVAGLSRLALAEDARAGAEAWSPEQGARILARLGDREPFLVSREAERHPYSLGRFFLPADYRRLRGNPVYGYWADDGFRWTGTRVAWDGIEAVLPSAKPIKRRAWNAAFAHVARKHGLVIDRRAPIRVRGACIAAVSDPSVEEPNRGVILELRMESPSGRFWYRFGMGKPTLEDAVGASLDWAVSFARTINRDADTHRENGGP